MSGVRIEDTAVKHKSFEHDFWRLNMDLFRFMTDISECLARQITLARYEYPDLPEWSHLSNQMGPSIVGPRILSVMSTYGLLGPGIRLIWTKNESQNLSNQRWRLWYQFYDWLPTRWNPWGTLSIGESSNRAWNRIVTINTRAMLIVGMEQSEHV